MNTNFIDILRQRKSTFPAPEEALSTANACNALSKDIYTDSTRFIYELLQNADDASCKSGSLYFHLEFIDDYLVVSHKGKAFDENDVESICSIGDGSKAADHEQTGFKGIGFKSVFAYSDLVYIKSGDFCFKFDKQESNTYWDSRWGEKQQWQQERRGKNRTAVLSMPWQIIPFNTEIPSVISDSSLSGYTVSTIIKCKRAQELKTSVEELFSSSQLILFLRSKNVYINIKAQTELNITKLTQDGITTISKNGEVISQWLMHTTVPFAVPSYVKEQMEADKDHYPEKLREAEKASISFAICLKDGKIEKLDAGTNNIYSFLPTTVSLYNFPFFVNSNFITDAGRQNLHNDYVWNQWLFEEIPSHYLNWMKMIAEEGQYGLNYLKVIVKKSGASDALGYAYDKGMAKALDEIAILPNKGEVLKVRESIIDKTRISSYISLDFVLAQFNNDNNAYSPNNVLEETYLAFSSKIEGLGCKVFDEEELKKMISSSDFAQSQDAHSNARLIEFLSKRYDLRDDKEETIQWLQATPFILSEQNGMLTPAQICFPRLSSDNANNDIDTISQEVNGLLTDRSKTWLREVGVSDVSDTSLIDTGKLFEDGFVTRINAIEICLSIFQLYKNKCLEENHYDKLRDIKLLTTKCSLKAAASTYLCSDYHPAFDLESFYTKDWYVSIDYVRNLNSAERKEFIYFLEKIGVSQNIEIESPDIHLVEESLRPETNEYRKEYCKKTIAELTVENPNEWAWSRAHTQFVSISTLDEVIDNYPIAKEVWGTILKNSISPSELFGDFTIWKYYGFHKKSYTSWLVENYNVLPTTLHKCMKSGEVYSNTIPHIQELAHDILPIIDSDVLVNQEWIDNLSLKDKLTIDDYLKFLSMYPEMNLDIEDAKYRIGVLYRVICELLPSLDSEQLNKLKNYKSLHKLLGRDNHFYNPQELSYITIPGFNASKQIYTDHVDEDILNLFRLLGITVIDHFEPKILEETQDVTLKTRLLECAPLLALLSLKDRTYLDELNKIQERISELSIMHASSISLTYGDNNDEQDRTTFYDNEKKCFYFTGDWEKPRVIVNLVEPLCEILHIKKSYSPILSVILLEPNFNDNKKYLEEQGFEIACVTDDLLPVKTTTFKGLTAREEMEIIENDVQDGNIPAYGVSGDSRISYAQEAQQRIMELLETNNCTFDANNHNYTLLYSVKKPDGSMCKAVMKSARGGYLYFTPREWLELACDHPVLLVVDRNNQIRNVSLEELEESNDHFHMRFDTSTFAVKSNLKVFAQFFRPLPSGSVYFAFGVPYSISRANYLEEFGMDKQNTSAIDLTDDDINMLS